MNDYLLLTERLQEWATGQPPQPFEFEARHYQRLAIALLELQAGGSHVGVGDIGGLMRTVLLHETAAIGRPAELLVPSKAEGFPGDTSWQDYGISVVGRPHGALRIVANPWRPNWLPGSERDGGVDAPAYSATTLVQEQTVRIDPAVTELLGAEYTQYLSPGQAMAVRACFLMAPGQNVLVNLPTGQGKSLAFQAPILAAAGRGKVSLLVVPTVALAKDHERRFHEENWAAAPLAYHGGLSDEEKAAFRSRIARSEQPIVIASPEAVLSGLRRSLVECAKTGCLGYVVVDEAHMVDQWGTEFRPEYQFLASFRDLLSRESPPGQQPRTILLSATVTEEVFRTLERLFGQLRQVSAVYLRPEIEFWMRKASNRQEKVRMIRQAVRHLPRPFILYSSSVADAHAFYELVKDLDIHRVQKVIGGTNLEGVLEAWSSQRIDIVVATSAFGLGVDNSEVRAVVHGCIPESADRFYQEVGRGGRDGHSSISLTIYEQDDWGVARGLSSPRVIREQGWPRWKVMWNTKNYESGIDAWVVDLQAKPPNVFQEGERNRKWNRVTLSLMSRAGVIDLVQSIPDLSLLDTLESDADVKAFLATKHNEVGVRTLQEGALSDPAKWAAQVLEERRRAQQERHRAFDMLHDLFSERVSVNEILAKVYSFDGTKVQAPPGRCPTSRARRTDSSYYVPPCPNAPDVGPFSVKGWFAGLDGWPRYAVYDGHSSSWERETLQFLEIAVGWGFIETLIPPDWSAIKQIQKLHRRSPHRFVIVRDVLSRPCPSGAKNRGRTLSVPQVVLVPPTASPEQVLGTDLNPNRRESDERRRFILFEQNMLLPGHAWWRYIDHVPVTGTVPELLKELNEWGS